MVVLGSILGAFPRHCISLQYDCCILSPILLPHLRFIKDDYLQQNSFTKYDKYCPFYKSVEMMRNIVTFHRLASAAVEKTAGGNSEGQKITYNVIKQRMGDVLYKLTAQKFEDPGVWVGLCLIFKHAASMCNTNEA